MEKVIKNIVFWGEDAFSNVILTSLIQAGYNVKLVVSPQYDNLIYKRLDMTCTKNGIESDIPCTPCLNTSSAILNAL